MYLEYMKSVAPFLIISYVLVIVFLLYALWMSHCKTTERFANCNRLETFQTATTETDEEIERKFTRLDNTNNVGGSTIKSMTTNNIKKVRRECRNDPNCVGFTFNGQVGYLLSKLGTDQSETGWSVSRRNVSTASTTTTTTTATTATTTTTETDQEIERKFTRLDNTNNVGGSTIKSMTTNDIKTVRRECRNDPNCVGFTFNGQVGYLLSKLGTDQSETGWSVSRRNVSTASTTTTSTTATTTTTETDQEIERKFTRLDNTNNLGGSTIKSMTTNDIKKVRRECRNDPTCVGFTFNGQVGYLLSKLGTDQSETGWSVSRRNV